MEIRADIKDFNKAYEKITDATIQKSVAQIITSLKNDILVGEHMRRQIIPKYYVKRHNIQTLYRVALPHRWRLIYSIQTFYENERTALLLEIMDHKQYNKRFGYFKRKSA